MAQTCETCVSFRRSIRLNANAIENYTIHWKDTQQHEHINNKKIIENDGLYLKQIM